MTRLIVAENINFASGGELSKGVAREHVTEEHLRKQWLGLFMKNDGGNMRALWALGREATKRSRQHA